MKINSKKLIYVIIVIFFILLSISSLSVIYYNFKNNKIWNKQEKELLSLLKENIDNDKIYSDLGIINIHKRNYKIASNYFNKSININPNNYDANYWLVYLEIKNGLFDNAIKRTKKMIANFPDKNELYGNLGVLYEYNNDYLNAITFLTKEKILLENDLKLNSNKYDNNYIKVTENYIKEIDNRLIEIRSKIK